MIEDYGDDIRLTVDSTNVNNFKRDMKQLEEKLLFLKYEKEKVENMVKRLEEIKRAGVQDFIFSDDTEHIIQAVKIDKELLKPTGLVTRFYELLTTRYSAKAPDEK